MRRLTPPIAAALLACQSSAPYTLPAAAVGTGVAGAFSAIQRGLGGCYATCTNGTACNPKTGFCEKSAEGCACAAGEGCLLSASGVPRCVPPAMSVYDQQTQAKGAIQVHPETGYVPTLPVVPVPGAKPDRSPGARAR